MSQTRDPTADELDAEDSAHLTDRELRIAKVAAKIAVREIQSEFYRQVGRSVISKMLIYIGMGVVGFMVARGWVQFKL